MQAGRVPVLSSLGVVAPPVTQPLAARRVSHPVPRRCGPGGRPRCGRHARVRVLASTEVDSETTKKTAAQQTLDNLARLFPEEVAPQVEASQPAKAAVSETAVPPATGTTTPPAKTPEELERLLASMKNASEKQELSQAERDTMRRDLERLMESVSRNALLPPADVEEVRRKVFGYSTFFVTATELSAEYPGGVLFRGNKARGLRVADCHAAVTAGVQALFGDRYLVVCMEEPPDPAAFFNGDSAVDSSPPPPPAAGAVAGGAGPAAGGGSTVEEPQRISFVLVPSELAQPTPTTGWQLALAAVLALLTAGACAELGLEAQLAQLPRETLEFFAQPGAFDALPPGSAIPGLDSLNIGALFSSAAPITAGVLSCAASHELGHALAARLHSVKLSPPYLIPNGSLGTFGAVTQIKSVLQNRTQLFDVAFAGLAAGGAASALLFLAGLAASATGAHDLPVADGAAAVRAAALAAGLVPVPATLFQGSLLLGGLSTLALHPAGAEVFVHPAFVAGWCGLTATALNALPIGALDGGRIAMAAFGKRQLTPLSFGSYLGLALGLLGGALSLPFGLYALIVQRVPERQPLDAVSPPQEGRRRAATVALVAALATLLPLSLSLPAGTGM